MDKLVTRRDQWCRWYDCHLAKMLPRYALIPLLFCFVWNGLIYWGTQVLCAGRFHYDFTTAFDRNVPLQSQWILIYIASYVFWAVCYMMAAACNDREFFFRFVFSDLLAKAICGVIFVVVPTTNVRPDVETHGICNWLLRFIYHVDQPSNLFPSIHCLASLLSYLAVRTSKIVPKWVKGSILVFAILICASTQFTKQHYIVDVAGGIFVGLVAFSIARKTSWYKGAARLFIKINQVVYHED